MITWSIDPKQPNMLYTKVNTTDEYMKSIELLKGSIEISSIYCDEVFNYTLYPFDGDDSLWNDYFFKEYTVDNINYDKLVNKPDISEFPLALMFSGNNKMFYWISLNKL